MKTPASKIVIKDRDGVLPVWRMKQFFEEAIRQTPKLQSQPIEMGDGCYRNSETNLLWTGFALGMRCAERIQNQVETSNE